MKLLSVVFLQPRWPLLVPGSNNWQTKNQLWLRNKVKIEAWVNIYNVKMSKTEMACAPPKTCRNQKSFWDPSTYHPNTTGVGWVFFISKKHVLVGHPNIHIHMYNKEKTVKLTYSKVWFWSPFLSQVPLLSILDDRTQTDSCQSLSPLLTTIVVCRGSTRHFFVQISELNWVESHLSKKRTKIRDKSAYLLQRCAFVPIKHCP